MKTMLLTSTGFLNPKIADVVSNKLSALPHKNIAIITTAAEGKENNKYSQVAQKQLLEMGFKDAVFFDIETQDAADLKKYDAFYVCGGNTFKLLKHARESNLKAIIESLFEKNGLYIGVSAGSLLVGPSIQIAGEIEPDPNEVGLTDFTGLNLTEKIIFPHYENRFEEEIKDFEKKHEVQVTRIDNFQAILIEDNLSTLIQ